MTYFLYDKTFQGLLCAVFHAYKSKCFPDKLWDIETPIPLLTDEMLSLFNDNNHEGNLIELSEHNKIKIETTPENADRVWNGLKKKLSPAAMQSLSMAWLSELGNIDELIFRYICKALDHKSTPTLASIELNFADPDVLQIAKIWKKVNNERLRTIQFLRFQKAKDGTYFAVIEPKYDVLSLTIPHFTNRFSDQEWIIYDTAREYGYYYNKISAEEITFKELPQLQESLKAVDENLYSELWKTYFNAVCIKERINPKLHKQNLPARFWKNLTEKK